MDRTRLSLVLAASASLFMGCTLDFDQFLPGQGGSNTGGATSSSVSSTTTTTTTTTTTVSSSSGGCTDPAMCPVPVSDCDQATCVGMMCDSEHKAAHAMCAAGVCDGNGMCIGCVDTTDCMGTDICSAANTCVAASCSDMMKDGGETDTDCGGPCGATCMNTQTCAGFGDCLSGVCTALACIGCTQDSECQTGNYCDTPGAATGVCKPTITNGITCGADNQCASSHCVDVTGASPDKICCDTACAGTCSSCLAVENGNAQDGTCSNITINTDPKNACATSGTDCNTGACDGAGACGFKANNSNCGTGPQCNSTTQAHAQDKCNASGTCVAGANMNCTMNFSCTGTTCNSSCTMDMQCANSTHCDQNGGALDGTCQTCVSNAMNPAAGCMVPTPGCNLTNDTCVACAVNANCTTPANPACDTGSHTCKACAPLGSASAFCTTSMVGHACITGFVCGCGGDGDCSGIPNKTHCPLAGANQNTCQECVVDGDCLGNVKGQKCSPMGGVANTCGCDTDGATQCPTSPQTCNPGMHVCN